MNSLNDLRIANRLTALYQAAEGDAERWRERKLAQSKLAAPSQPDPLIRLGEFYIPVSRKEGELLYLLARAKNAGLIVEFGASFGISTLFFAAAARDTRGRVITTEVHPKKCAALRASFAEAGVEDVVSLLEGDARETLKAVEEPIDLLFLDGWKSLYLPIFDMLRPRLSVGALILADNISFAESQDYLEAVQAPGNGLLTQVIDDLAISCVLDS